MDTDGDPAGDLRPHAADVPPERHSDLGRFEFPACRFQPAARHAVSANPFGQFCDMTRGLHFHAQDTRSDEVSENHPRRIYPLLVVVRRFTAGDFTKALDMVDIFDFDHDDPTLVGASETRLKVMHEWHPDHVQADSRQLHQVTSSDPLAARAIVRAALPD